MSGITEDMRSQMQAINANLGHIRKHSSSTRFFKHNGREVVEIERPGVVHNHSMFPYFSTQMACDPEDIQMVREMLKKEGLYVDFDGEGRPEVTSTKQQDALAKALKMKTGRDGYGHLDEHGRFQNSGRRRADEMKEGRARVRRVIQELEKMPEEVPASVVDAVFDEYDIRPTEENTG